MIEIKNIFNKKTNQTRAHYYSATIKCHPRKNCTLISVFFYLIII